MFSGMSDRQKRRAICLSDLMVSVELKTIREYAQRVTFDAVRGKTGFRATEEQLALGYMACVDWLKAADLEGRNQLFNSSAEIRLTCPRKSLPVEAGVLS
jgi:hypothetical protein